MHRLLDQRGINSVHTIKPRKAQYGPFPPGVPDDLVRALARQGIKKLYAHQSEAAGHIMAGRNVIITTGTSSGKSMVYTIPVFSALFDNPRARALYISPAKALGQNQAGAMNELAGQIDWPGGRPVITTCDGDTPQNERRGIINESGVVITTPDFIHACLLPRHRSWPGFFTGLQYVIIDEAHVLKGVLGCHCLQVFRRLRRICDYYGARPVFILCTATIANPGDFAGNLTGLLFRAVTGETSAAGEKTVVFYEPPTYETEDGQTKRRLTHFEAARAVGRYVAAGRRTIMFCRSRRVVESAYRKLQENFPGTSGQVTTYKGTYSPQFRREIESRLFTGKLKGVITTNALELGINVGDLDTCILAGFAGSISSTWQQAGRVGRKGQKSLIVLMANEDPLDFYIVRHPHYFFGQPFEKAVVSEKMQFLADHLPLAAAELPLRKEDAAYWEQGIYYEAVKLLLKHGRLRLITDRPKTYGPAVDLEFFSLRGESDNYQTLDPDGRLVEQYNYDDVLKDAYPGAILPVYDRMYLVDEIDFDRKIIKLKDLPQQMVGCYTKSVINSQITVEKVERTRQEDNFTAHTGVLNIHKSFAGYTLVDVVNETKNMYEPKQLIKPIDFPTAGIWLDINLSSLASVLKYEAVHALKHLLHIVIPLEVMCERNDLGASMLVEGDNARIFIYDNYAGGVGLAESALADIKRILERSYELVTGCGCTGGCPSCIIIPQCLQANERLSKEGVIKLLAGILGKETSRMHIPIRSDKENITVKAGSRVDIRLEARALEMEMQEHARAVDHAREHLPAVAECVKSLYGRRLIKQEATLLAVLYLLTSYTGKPVPGRVLKQVVAQCTQWSVMYRLSLRNLRDRGFIAGSDEQFALLPGVEKDIDRYFRKAARQ
jgi:DEAD/DEAH box helicase domain-containing protein